MANVTLLGIDTAKNSFELYGIDSNSKVVLKKTLTRQRLVEFVAALPKCTIVMEACGGSHHWGRVFMKHGHEVKLLAPQKVAPFCLGNKNDSNDAKAIVHAALCPGMEFVTVKQVWQQDIQALHRIRERCIRNQTALANEMRGILAEYGIVARKGINHVRGMVPELLQDSEQNLSAMIKSALADLHCELLNVTDCIERMDAQLAEIAKINEPCQRLLAIDGVGIITATAVLAAVADPNLFKNGRQFAAWLGLVPGHRQTGGKSSGPIMLGITKKGDTYLRKLLVQGAMSVVRQACRKPKAIEGEESQKAKVTASMAPHRKRKKVTVPPGPKHHQRRLWLQGLIETKGTQKAAVAYANKNARTILAMLRSGEIYRTQAAEAA